MKEELNTKDNIETLKTEELIVPAKEKIKLNKAVVTMVEDLFYRDPIFVDTETTGLNRKKDDKVIEICAVDIFGKVLINELVNPEREIPEDAIKIHGITNEMVSGKPKLYETTAIKQLDYYSKNQRPIIFYNARYDMTIISQSIEGYDDVSDIRTIDLMESYRLYVGAPRSIGLTLACTQMGVKAGTHRALEDSLALGRLLWALKKKIEPNLDITNTNLEEHIKLLEQHKS